MHTSGLLPRNTVRLSELVSCSRVITPFFDLARSNTVLHTCSYTMLAPSIHSHTYTYMHALTTEHHTPPCSITIIVLQQLCNNTVEHTEDRMKLRLKLLRHFITAVLY